MKSIRQNISIKGERALAIEPEPGVRVESCWNSRLNFYSGRTLTRTALDREQKSKSNHLAICGRKLSPGVVEGLEISFDIKPSISVGTPPQILIRVEPGMGMTASGELICVDTQMQATLSKLQVKGRDPNDPSPPSGIGVLLLEPVTADDAWAIDGGFPCDIDRSDNAFKNPCEIDPADDAFENWRLLDGARLVWFPWPMEWMLFMSPDAEKFRNFISYEIFDREIALNGRLPWEKTGVPLSLLSLTPQGDIAFADRYAVVRQGGAPLYGMPMTKGGGDPFLWQARIQHFAAHMTDLFEKGESLEQAMKKIRFLPPVGVVPKDFVDLKKKTLDFMPASYHVEAAPIPADQFGLVVEASASLMPFDLFVSDRMKILVPVDAQFYEPALLKKANPDPVFEQTTGKLLEQLNLVLGKRAILRLMGNVTSGALDIEKLPKYATPDTDALPGEVPDTTATVDADMADKALYRLGTLHNALDGFSLLSDDELKIIKAPVNDNEPPYQYTYSGDFKGVETFIREMEKKIDQSDDAINIGFLKVQTDMYRFRQMMLGNTKATRLATSPVLAQIAKGKTSVATEKNIDDYFKTVETRAGNIGTTVEREAPYRAESTGADYLHGRMAKPAEAAPYISVPGKTIGRTAGDVRAGIGISKRKGELFSAVKGDQPFEMLEATVIDVTGQQPIAGESLDIRTTNIAERLSEPPGPEAKSYAVSTKAHVFGSLAALPINVSKIDVNLTSGDTAILTPAAYSEWLTLYKLNTASYETVLAARVLQGTNEVFVDLKPLSEAEKTALESRVLNFRNALNALFRRNEAKLSSPGLAANILAGRYDPSPANGDEAAFLSVGVSALENTLGALRKVEGLVHRYRKIIKKAKEAVSDIREYKKRWEAMLLENDHEVALIRHDLSVARSLFEEEKKRVNGINARRADVLKNHVPFVAFARPRTVSIHRDLPAAVLHGVFEDPVPLCFMTDTVIPDALEEMLDLFREIPIKWLPEVKALIKTVDRHDRIISFFTYAVEKAQIKTLSEPAVVAAPVFFQAASGFGKATAAIIEANKQTGRSIMMKKADIQIDTLTRMTWKQIRKKAEAELSLSDLVESGKGKTAVAQKAVLELVHMENVAGCFYAMCGEVPPKVRWRWAERISVFDRPVSLDALSRLPGWSNVDFDLRRDMQALVDWLFKRVDRQIPQAVSMINDLVRISILLASHAPVAGIISGHIPKPVKGRVGDIVDLVVDKGVASVGMRVDIYKSLEINLNGVIEDIKEDMASVRITSAKDTVFDLAGGAIAKIMRK